MTDSYRPEHRGNGGPPPMPAAVDTAMYRFQGNSNPPRGPRGYQVPIGPRFQPSNRNNNYRNNNYGGISSRPLLRVRQDANDESFLQPNAVSKFRDLDKLTDSEEDEMSESDEDSRPSKRVRTQAIDSPRAAATPKWSNPDPYTALPPPPEATGKRTDVVKLIRKAKISDEADRETSELAKNADFISFDTFDGSFDESLDVSIVPKAGDPDHLGKRKRDHEDARPRPPRGYPHSEKDAPVLREYQASGYISATPWLSPVSSSDSAAIALHKEIIDFHAWVRPKDYEQEVRTDVLKRLSRAFNQIENGGTLKAFGSYAAGLYLPTGDMDLVWLQLGFRPGQSGANGLPTAAPRSLLNKFAKRLRDKGLARANSVQLIPWAKVPIIKFIDDVSGIRIDLSFNNDTGVTANETVQRWKSQYPPMPFIVSIIKQFLKVRGLNDVAVGGLGGFSIICLVTSHIQHMPGTTPPSNLGDILLHFFNLYGNLFDRNTVAIRLDPPGYIDKAKYQPHLFNKEKAGRLTIIDPNRPENNISGGTHEIDTIMSSFSSAYSTLQQRLGAFADHMTDTGAFSFLRDLVGGNFASYDDQRTVSKGLYFGLTGKDAVEQQTRPPPPPPPPNMTRAPPPPQPSGSGSLPSKPTTNGVKLAPTAVKPPTKALKSQIRQTNQGTGTSSTRGPRDVDKSERRATRLKAARPECLSS